MSAADYLAALATHATFKHSTGPEWRDLARADKQRLFGFPRALDKGELEASHSDSQQDAYDLLKEYFEVLFFLSFIYLIPLIIL